MRSENFVYFFTVWGFFVGFIVSIFKSDAPEELIYYTLLVTIFFYLFSHLIVAFYFRTSTQKIYLFPKESHESKLDHYVLEIIKREKLVDSIGSELAKEIKESRELDR